MGIGTDPSEADLSVRELQKAWIEPLTTYEQDLTVRFTEKTPISIGLERLRVLLNP